MLMIFKFLYFPISAVGAILIVFFVIRYHVRQIQLNNDVKCDNLYFLFLSTMGGGARNLKNFISNTGSANNCAISDEAIDDIVQRQTAAIVAIIGFVIILFFSLSSIARLLDEN
jgi:hypothetical protein